MRRLIIIDVSNFIFRAFYAIRPLTAPDGTPVNAVYGVLTMLHRLVQDFQPTHVCVARDTKEPSFRKEKYAEYKANRTEPPDMLVPQFALVEELLDAMGLPAIVMPGYEADDIIGCLATRHRGEFDEILIASGDKDLMQFVDDKVKMLDTMKEKVYGPADVLEKMGVPPSQIVDYLSLIGDSSDNIPGVPGIGPKGAVALLQEFGTLEACLERASEVKAKKTQSALIEHAELARVSKELATIRCDLDLPLSLEQLAYNFELTPKLSAFLDRLGFRTFLAKVSGGGTKPSAKPAAAAAAADTTVPVAAKPVLPVPAGAPVEQLPGPDALKSFLAKGEGPVAVFPWWRDDQDPHAPLAGLAVARDSRAAVVSPEVEDGLWRALAGASTPLLAWELKPLWTRFLRLNLAPPVSSEDLAQMHFVLAPEGRHDLDTVARELDGEGLPELEGGQTDLLESNVAPDALAARARTILRAWEPLCRKIKDAGVERAYRELDLPLLAVLARMEAAGITLDVPFFQALEKEFEAQTKGIEAEVEKLAGHPVNLRSPKQIAQLLFEEQKLPVIRKTKTGYSTDVDVLEELAASHDNPIPGMLIRYREVEKLNSTYVRALPKMVHPSDGRVHTHFRPGNAATGRLSSDNPNLQNIPVRTENGRRLRRGFVAAPGMRLLSADYSQVELRILAHFSEDPVMMRAFAEDRDIHAMTAAEVFGVPLDQVTKENRNAAKGINFGLMYGQTSFGLSQALRISQAQAKDYITNYFRRFGRVKAYLDGLKEAAEATGYAETLFGRRRLVPDIKSQNRQIKAMAERIAINSPIQGTAADIIKLAMLRVQAKLEEGGFRARMLLQVHDELIFEAPPEEIELLGRLVRQEMEHAVELKVPIKVDMGTGSNWYELK